MIVYVLYIFLDSQTQHWLGYREYIINTPIIKEVEKIIKTPDIKEIEKIFRERRHHVADICEKNKQQGQSDLAYLASDQRLNQKVRMLSHLLDNSRKVMYCWNHKVASSSWMWMFTKIRTGRELPPGEPTYRIQYHMSPRNISSYYSAVTSYNNILLVRHPFERLLSAYRDRVAGGKTKYRVYKNMEKILGLKRVDTVLKAGPVAIPTWPEFVKYLIRTSQNQDVSMPCTTFY